MKSQCWVNSVLLCIALIFCLKTVRAQDPAEKGRQTVSNEPLILTLQEGITLVLRNNLDIIIDRQNPVINRSDITIQKSAFDPTLTLNFSADRSVVTPF